VGEEEVNHRIIPGDCIAGLRTLPDASVHCCVTSPPYWGLRDYGHDGQIGLEDTPEAYVARMVDVFREVRRVLRDDGTLWLNLGDSYANQKSGDTYSGFNDRYFGRETDGGKQAKTASSANVGRLDFSGLKPKDLVGIPWRVAFALQADGWWLRQDIIWHKPNPMPESVRDRCTKAHEYVFLLTKSERYFYDAEAVKESGSTSSAAAWYRKNSSNRTKPAGATTLDGNESHQSGLNRPGWERPDTLELGRNRRSVWTVTTKPYKGAHFATMPPDLVKPCILAGTSEEGCCPLCGSPWERITKRSKLTRPRPNDYTKRQGEEGTGNSCANSVAGVAVETLGWQQSCDCDCQTPGTVPCLVLDPFAGSGTTLAVAARLGRSGVGCELNPEYIALAEQRIAEAREKEGLFA
jgi:DNA modification methylase